MRVDSVEQVSVRNVHIKWNVAIKFYILDLLHNIKSENQCIPFHDCLVYSDSIVHRCCFID